jgi:hypothetical protein
VVGKEINNIVRILSSLVPHPFHKNTLNINFTEESFGTIEYMTLVSFNVHFNNNFVKVVDIRNPNGYKLLDIRNPSSWPVDILWKHRTDTGHFHGHAETGHTHGNEAGTKAKDQQVATQKSEVKSSGVNMYRHDMSKWNLDDSKCHSQTQFLFANMHTSVGDVRIYVHDPSVDVHVSGSLMRDGAWEPHLLQLMFSLRCYQRPYQKIRFLSYHLKH